MHAPVHTIGQAQASTDLSRTFIIIIIIIIIILIIIIIIIIRRVVNNCNLHYPSMHAPFRTFGEARLILPYHHFIIASS
jgi:hypothetical protein